MLEIFVDADGCPVKQEVFRVAERYELPVYLVANAPLKVPGRGKVEMVVVGMEIDAADDWIAGRVAEGDIVVTADIPLAARCLAQGARALTPRGQVFTESRIGEALASRDIAEHMRDLGLQTRGPKTFGRQDRSRFLSRLDETINAVRRQFKK